jgi:hypothetical protein
MSCGCKPFCDPLWRHQRLDVFRLGVRPSKPRSRALASRFRRQLLFQGAQEVADPIRRHPSTRHGDQVGRECLLVFVLRFFDGAKACSFGGTSAW